MTLCTSVAIMAALLARRPLRRAFGAAATYQAWLMVPAVAVAAGLAALLPEHAAPQILVVQAPQAVQQFAAQATPAGTFGQADIVLLAWAAGALIAMSWFVIAHHAFLRRAGTLTRSGAVYLSEADVGPASVGLLRPKIVVPRDFSQRYTCAEQALVIAHEQTHIARRDAIANLLAALLQCLFWFNPLMHLGLRVMRQDQELACDAAVVARHPHQRRVYAEALLKSHGGGAIIGAGIHCHWQSPHPTKERIMNLQHTLPGNPRRVAGRCLVAALAFGAAGAAFGVRAEATASASAYAVAMAIDATSVGRAPFQVQGGAFEVDPGKGESAPRVITHAGENFSVAANGWRAEMVLRPANGANEVWVYAKLFKGSELVSTPTLLSRIGEKATIQVGDSDQARTLSMIVTPQP